MVESKTADEHESIESDWKESNCLRIWGNVAIIFSINQPVSGMIWVVNGSI